MSFPRDLISEILCILQDDPKSLLSLCLVSSDYRAEAQKLLYRRLAFQKLDMILSGSFPRKGYDCYIEGSDEVDLLQWVFPKERLKPFLISVTPSCVTPSYIQELSCSDVDASKLLPFLSPALRQMPNLKCLRLMVGDPKGHTPVTAQDLLADLPFQLVQMCWIDLCRTGGEKEFIDALMSFFSSQYKLEHLHLASPNRECSPLSKPINCPTLNTYIGDFKLIGPPLQPYPTTLGFVSWPTGWISLPSLLKAVPSPFSGLRTLIVYYYEFRYTNLKLLAKSLESLEILHIVIEEGGFTGSYNASDNAKLLHHVHHMSQLRKFIWTSYNEYRIIGPYTPIHIDFQKDFAEHWFRALSGFEVAYFSCGDKADLYARWTRGSTEPQEVSSSEVHHLTVFSKITLDRRLVLGV